MRQRLIALLGVPWISVAGAQEHLAQRMHDVGTRTVAFSTRSRPEVCGDGSTSMSDGLGSGCTFSVVLPVMLPLENAPTSSPALTSS